jgi:hypothetical protein
MIGREGDQAPTKEAGMKTRQLFAVLTIAAVSVVGSAGVAVAQTNPTNPPSASATGKQAKCDKALARLSQIAARDAKVEARIALLNTSLADAQGENHTRRAEVLQKRIDASQKVHDHLVALTGEINARCAT